MNVIAKMRCTSVEDYGWSRRVKLACVHDNGINVGDTPENISFTKATPTGEAWMTIDNKHAWSAFHPPIPGGNEVDGFTTVPETTHYVIFVDATEHSLEDVHKALAALA